MSKSMISPASSCWLILRKKLAWTRKSVNLTTGTNNCVQKGTRRKELTKCLVKQFISERPQPPVLSFPLKFATKSSWSDCTPIRFSLFASMDLLQVPPWAEMFMGWRWENGMEGTLKHWQFRSFSMDEQRKSCWCVSQEFPVTQALCPSFSLAQLSEVLLRVHRTCVYLSRSFQVDFPGGGWESDSAGTSGLSGSELGSVQGHVKISVGEITV